MTGNEQNRVLRRQHMNKPKTGIFEGAAIKPVPARIDLFQDPNLSCLEAVCPTRPTWLEVDVDFLQVQPRKIEFKGYSSSIRRMLTTAIIKLVYLLFLLTFPSMKKFLLLLLSSVP